MASLYDSYELANSTQTPAYVGSDLGEKISVLSQLQQRYDQAHQADDMLARTAQDAQVNEQDKPFYNDVIDKYRQRIATRASSGDYENMQMATARDAYDYAGDYKAFGHNNQLVQARQAEIQKMSDKGPDKGGIGAETADALRAELNSYSGLKKDDNGQYTNFYSGHAIAPDVDVDKKVKEWASDIVSNDVGYEVRAEKGIDGQLHYVTRSGKTETVTSDQIKNAINYGSQSDQGFKDYLHQKQRLETIGTDKYSYGDIDKVHGSQVAAQIQEEADRQGTTVGNIYRQMRMQQVQNDVANNAWKYGMKYLKNNVTTGNLDDGLTEAAKKALVPDNNFAVPVTLGAYGSAFNTPDKLNEELDNSKKRATQTQQDMQQWIHTNGIKAINSGGQVRYINPQGTDVTDQAQRQKLLVQQEQAHQNTLNQIDADAKKQTGYHVTPGDLSRAREAYNQAYSHAQTTGDFSGGEGKANLEAYAQQAYDSALKDNPLYANYKQAIADKTQALTLTTSAMRFQNEEDNKRMENAVNNLSTSDFKSNMLGIKHMGTTSNGEPFTPDEYNTIKGKIHFSGQVIGADGQQHSLFKAEDPKSKNDVVFSVDGISSTQPMPKLMGIDAQQSYTQQMIRAATNNPGKRASIPLSPGVNLNLRILGPDEADQFGNGKYKISITGPNGTGGQEINVDDENQLLQKVGNVLKAHGK